MIQTKEWSPGGADSDTRSDSRTRAVEMLRRLWPEKQIQKLGQAKQTEAQPDKTDLHACRLTRKSWNSCSRLKGELQVRSVLSKTELGRFLEQAMEWPLVRQPTRQAFTLNPAFSSIFYFYLKNGKTDISDREGVSNPGPGGPLFCIV